MITVFKDTTVKALWVDKATVTFDANGGGGSMASAEVVKGAEYTLPANTFTPPTDKEFKAWEVAGVEKAVGAKITVSADTLVKAVWKDKPETPNTVPVITEGKNGKWTQGQAAGLTFKSDADYADFIKVEVDGKELAAKNYTVASGSTVVTLKSEYLKSLAPGKHTLGIVSKNGTAVTNFEILAAKANAVPKTGDTQNLAPALLIMLLSSSALAGTLITRRKRAYGK